MSKTFNYFVALEEIIADLESVNHLLGCLEYFHTQTSTSRKRDFENGLSFIQNCYTSKIKELRNISENLYLVRSEDDGKSKCGGDV